MLATWALKLKLFDFNCNFNFNFNFDFDFDFDFRQLCNMGNPIHIQQSLLVTVTNWSCKPFFNDAIHSKKTVWLKPLAEIWKISKTSRDTLPFRIFFLKSPENKDFLFFELFVFFQAALLFLQACKEVWSVANHLGRMGESGQG